MPYEKKSDLPDPVKNNLPEHAQEIYKDAFNSAWEQYKDLDAKGREETSHKVAWGAVEQEYKKNNDGRWVKK